MSPNPQYQKCENIKYKPKIPKVQYRNKYNCILFAKN